MTDTTDMPPVDHGPHGRIEPVDLQVEMQRSYLDYAMSVIVQRALPDVCALSRHPLFRPYLALLAVCFFWGTTYLGIRMALESFPPMLLVCVRFIISGSMLLAFARIRGLYLPKGKELAWACFSGLLTLGIGNGALVLSETRIPSGIAGLIVTISPFWMVGVEALLPGGERLHWPTIGGMARGASRRGAALRTGRRRASHRPQSGGRLPAAAVRHGGLELRIHHSAAKSRKGASGGCGRRAATGRGTRHDSVHGPGARLDRSTGTFAAWRRSAT